MANKIKFSKTELQQILSNYNLGVLKNSKVFTGGSVQINILLQTTKGKYVLRYYKQGRPLKSVMFELNLILLLKTYHYPCPAPLKNKTGEYIGIFKNKPYIIFEFAKGEHLTKQSEKQKKFHKQE